LNVVTWTPGEPPPQTKTHGARKYTGAVATGYDAKREDSQKWKDEDRIVRDMVKEVAKSGDWALDVPFGTGRFIPLYEEIPVQVWAYDISEDMLQVAMEKMTKPENFRPVVGDVQDMSLQDKSVDVGVMVRLTRWLEKDERRRALAQLQRICRKRIIFTARVRQHPLAYSYSDIEADLDGWEIVRDEPAGDENYRVIALEPVDALG
jgi:ubiquinone/menaquinone biosynthesis C-methylase UbiE